MLGAVIPYGENSEALAGSTGEPGRHGRSNAIPIALAAWNLARGGRRLAMKAAVLAEKGLEIRDMPAPRPKPNEVLVRVRASGLNRADLAMAAGHRHGSLGGAGAIAGLEWAGEVAEIGAEVRGLKPGDRVMCSGAGGYAEYAVTDWGRVSPIPANNMSYEQAATLPIALQTMHDALVTNGRLKPGQSVLLQ